MSAFVCAAGHCGTEFGMSVCGRYCCKRRKCTTRESRLSRFLDAPLPQRLSPGANTKGRGRFGYETNCGSLMIADPNAIRVFKVFDFNTQKLLAKYLPMADRMCPTLNKALTTRMNALHALSRGSIATLAEKTAAAFELQLPQHFPGLPTTKTISIWQNDIPWLFATQLQDCYGCKKMDHLSPRLVVSTSHVRRLGVASHNALSYCPWTLGSSKAVEGN